MECRQPDILDECVDVMLEDDILLSDVSILDEARSELDAWANDGCKLSFNPCVLPDNFWKYPSEQPHILYDMIVQLTHLYGNKINLNWIDVSNLTDMSELFSGHNVNFQGNISKWNVSNVKNMSQAFWGSKFNGNISKWNVSSVETMVSMFATSSFNGVISKWDISSAIKMDFMFAGSEFNQNISEWDISNVRSMNYMFYSCEFNQDISKWRIWNKTEHEKMFESCSIEKSYLPKFIRRQQFKK